MYLYVFHTRGSCKVGISRDPERRLKDLQGGAFNKIVIVDTYPVDATHARDLEAFVHQALEKRFERRGEWFKGSRGEVSFTVYQTKRKFVPNATLPRKEEPGPYKPRKKPPSGLVEAYEAALSTPTMRFRSALSRDAT